MRQNTPTFHHVFTGLKAPQRRTSRLLRLSKRADPRETGAAPASRLRVFCCTSITPSLAPLVLLPTHQLSARREPTSEDAVESPQAHARPLPPCSTTRGVILVAFKLEIG